MPERLHQFRFDEYFQPASPQDVTPEHFTGLIFPRRGQEIQLTPAGEMGRFVREVKENIIVTSPNEAARYLLEKVYTPFEHFDQEEVWVLLLNAKNRITHEAMVYRGTVNAAYIRVAEIFKEAVRVNATGLILSHCHPSGEPAPSPQDVDITRHAKEVADLLAITLEDHIIVGNGIWVSLRSQGLGFEGE